MKYFLAIIIILICNVVAAAPPQSNSTLDESSLFQETTIKEVAEAKKSNLDELNLDKKSVNFTGQLRFDGRYLVDRNWAYRKGSWKNNQLWVYTDADLFLDIRLKKGIKAFLDIGLVNLSSRISSSNPLTTYVDIKELFVDFNFQKKAYFRVGKQFLQWSRTYLWNPIDLVNLEKRDFLDLYQIRSGTYGFRANFPLGFDQNLYFFLNTANIDNLEQLSLVSRYEFLVGTSEIGLSMWNQRQSASVYGLDLSSRIAGWDFKSELTLSYGSNVARMKEKNTQLVTENITGRWVPKATVNIGKTFNWERANRIMFNYEIFYNGEGYSENLFRNNTKKNYLLDNNLYLMNYHASLYQALFLNISEFPTHSTSWNFNLIQNLVDYSGICFTGLTYRVTEGFQIAGNIAGFFGDDSSEYLQSGKGWQAQFLSTLSF